MSVDPVFDCSFWYTNEYLQANGDRNWLTRIASFKFPGCIGCVGDCNRDHIVRNNELILVLNINQGTAPITDCLRGDANGDGAIDASEVNQATNNFLHGCPTGSTAPVGGAEP